MGVLADLLSMFLIYLGSNSKFYSFGYGDFNKFILAIFNLIRINTLSLVKLFQQGSNRNSSISNKIELYSTSQDRIGFINNNNDIVLSFPFKDAVLEAGMSKEDLGREERFLHLEVDGSDIDTLFESKVLTNFKLSVNQKILKSVKDIEFFDENGDLKQNLLIKGNNLLALYSLREQLAGKVKLIYIDPPYNTGNDGFKYNDNFNHSAWLAFIKNRLEVARDLLKEDGAIFISCDDNESHYLKILSDEIFGRENFVANVIWQKKFSPQSDAKWLSDNHDHILISAKNKEVWRPNLLPRSDETDSRYSNLDNDPRGVWASSDMSVRTYTETTDYPITTPFGRIVNPADGRCWSVSKEKSKRVHTDFIQENFLHKAMLNG